MDAAGESGGGIETESVGGPKFWTVLVNMPADYRNYMPYVFDVQDGYTEAKVVAWARTVDWPHHGLTVRAYGRPAWDAGLDWWWPELFRVIEIDANVPV